jgi:peptidoglycan hydrolase-like protein with peptidoglycan-binding domain
MRARLVPASLGDDGPDVAWAQGKLGIAPADGVFDEATAARVRGLQLANRLPITGELDGETVACLIRLR